ncbi:hypothetical protein [Rhodoferax sp. GW822-FHT02A01]|uniref:hypothetical protein n=1 Tax=Rhodoferax sp. GW822-FHT02A01 TaxID=3141537 RepID=UPI00315DA8C6
MLLTLAKVGLSLNNLVPMMRNLIVSLGLLTASMLSLADLMGSSFVPKEESTFAKEFFQKIQSKDFESVKSQIDPALASQVPDEKLIEIAGYFPSGNLLSTELIGSQVNVVNSNWQGNFTFEYHFEHGWVVSNVVLTRVNGKLLVMGFHVYQTQASQKEINKFSLAGKSPLQYSVFAFVILTPLFILVTLITSIRTPIPKRKWLWILFILGGIGTISVNWTTGDFGFQVVQYQLFGAGAFAAGEYAPWVLTVGLPIGAIAFWFMRVKWNKSIISDPQVNEIASAE